MEDAVQTGAEDYDTYIARGRGDDRQRIMDMLEARLEEEIGRAHV